MDPKKLEQEVQEAEEEFHVSKYIIIYKFVLGFIEFILGLGILFYGKKAAVLYRNYKANEFLEDPRDLLIII